MTNEFLKITDFMIQAFIHIWPYLLITIPIAVVVNMSGASAYIKRAFNAGPVAAVLLATIVGAFSPFCSCSVIPVVAALLIGGVPLPPVMAFWIASPSMDPEIFFLSVGTIGLDLAVWRLLGTLVMSLGAGFITLALVKAGWIRQDVLKQKKRSGTSQRLVTDVSIQPGVAEPGRGSQGSCGGSCGPAERGCSGNPFFWKQLAKASVDATWMVVKFMALAFFLEALIVLYVPREWITGLMGNDNAFAILTAAILGIPVYTSNISALPMVSGLLVQGLSPAAGLAFLIAGPTTTLPAMAAVWSLVKLRIFLLYVSFSLVGAILLGYAKLVWG